MKERTTIHIDSNLLTQVAQLTGLKTKTEIVQRSLETVIRLESGKRLANLGGVDKKATAGKRRRS